jgi:hypothetical protein
MADGRRNGNGAEPTGRSDFRIGTCRNTRFTCMIAGRNVGGTSTADAAETRGFRTPKTGTVRE